MKTNFILVALAIATPAAFGGTLSIEPGKHLPSYLHVPLALPNDGQDLYWGHTVADLNKDGRPDILATEFLLGALAHGTVRIYLQRPSGEFIDTGNYFVNDNTHTSVDALNVRILVGDFVEDGNPDFIVEDFGASGLVLFAGRGDGTFKESTRPNIVVVGHDAVTLDYNNDGHLDLIAEGSLGGLSLFSGDGQGNFTEAGNLQTSGMPAAIQVGDLNNDGKIDVMTGSFLGAGPNRAVDVFLGRGDGSFAPALVTEMGNSAGRSNALGDLNGDGNLDYVASDRDISGIQVWLGQGDGSFKKGPVVAFAEAIRVRVGDVNNDSIPDIVAMKTIRSGGGPLGIFLGKGDGSFESRRDYGVGAGRMAFWSEIADMNGDGRSDLTVLGVATSIPNVLSVNYDTGLSNITSSRALVGLEGFSGSTNVLEWSSDLATWSPLGTNYTTRAWRYNHAPSTPRGFYRARSL